MFGFDTASPFRICLPTFAANIWIVKESKTTCRKLISATSRGDGLRKIRGTFCDGLVTLAWVGGHGLVGGGEKFGSGRRSESARSLCSSLCPLLASASRGVPHFPKALTACGDSPDFLITWTTFLGHKGSERKRDQFSSYMCNCSSGVLELSCHISPPPPPSLASFETPRLPPSCLASSVRRGQIVGRERHDRPTNGRPTYGTSGGRRGDPKSGTRAATRRSARCSERERRVVDTPW